MIKKIIAYIGAFINFRIGCLMHWLRLNTEKDNELLCHYYLSFMSAAIDWQEWGGIKYPW